MNITVNDEPRDVTATNLAAALTALGYDDTVVATALNGRFVPAPARADTTLNEGDRVEIVAPMQGG